MNLKQSVPYVILDAMKHDLVGCKPLVILFSLLLVFSGAASLHDEASSFRSCVLGTEGKISSYIASSSEGDTICILKTRCPEDSLFARKDDIGRNNHGCNPAILYKAESGLGLVSANFVISCHSQQPVRLLHKLNLFTALLQSLF